MPNGKYEKGTVSIDPESGQAWIFDGKEWVPHEYKYGPVQGALMALQNGLLLGYGDDLAAAGRAVGDKVMGLFDKDRPQRSYTEHQAMVQGGMNTYARENPRVTGAATVTGATLPLVAATVASGGTATPGMLPAVGRTAVPNLAAQSTRAGTTLGAMKDGALYGGLYGAAQASGDRSPAQRMRVGETLGDMAVEGGKAALLGAGITGAISALQEPSRRMWQYVRQHVPGVPPPAGVAPQAAPAANPGRMAQSRVLGAIEDAGMTPTAVRAAVQQGRASGVPSMPIDFAGQPAQRLTRGVRTMDPKAGNLIDERLNARAEGQMERVANQVEQGIGARPLGPAALPEMAAQRQAAADPLYTAARQRGPIMDPAVIQNLRERASVYQPLHEASRKAAERNRGTGVVSPLYNKQGKLRRPPTTDDIQMIKEGADRRLYNDKRGVSEPSSAMSPGDRRDLQMTFRANREGDDPGLLPLVDRAVPKYGQARAQFAGDTAVSNALEEGLEVVGKSSDEISSIVGGLTSEGEREAFRRGAVYGIRQQLMKAQDRSEYANVLNSIFGWGKGSKREALRGLFPDDASFARFQASAEAEIAAVKSRRMLQSGSNTADKLVEAADVAGLGHDVAEAASGNIVNPAVRQLMKLTNPGAGTRYEIADQMTSMYGNQADDFLKALEALRQQRLRQVTTLGPALRTGAAVSGQQEYPQRLF